MFEKYGGVAISNDRTKTHKSGAVWLASPDASRLGRDSGCRGEGMGTGTIRPRMLCPHTFNKIHYIPVFLRPRMFHPLSVGPYSGLGKVRLNANQFMV